MGSMGAAPDPMEGVLLCEAGPGCVRVGRGGPLNASMHRVYPGRQANSRHGASPHCWSARAVPQGNEPQATFRRLSMQEMKARSSTGNRAELQCLQVHRTRPACCSAPHTHHHAHILFGLCPSHLLRFTGQAGTSADDLFALPHRHMGSGPCGPGGPSSAHGAGVTCPENCMRATVEAWVP